MGWKLPYTALTADLKPSEFKILVALYEVCDGYGEILGSKEELSRLTGLSLATLTRSFRGLEAVNYLATRRVRKGRNFFAENSYQLLVRGAEDEQPKDENPVKSGWPEVKPRKLGSIIPNAVSLISDRFHDPTVYVSLTDDRSTASKLTKVVNSYIPTSSKVTSNYKSINFVNTYCAQAQEGTKMNKWQDDSSSLAGFGLLEDEQPKPVAKINKRDYRTRHQRPEHEWTPYDVAAEFSSGLGQRFPYLAGLVNTGVVAGALRRYRSQIGTDAAVETELLRMFFEDPYKLRDIEKSDPMKIPGRYLNMFKTDINEALRRIGLPQHKQVTVKPEPVQQVLRPVTIRGVDFVMDDEYVYTSDGEAFDKASSMHNSILEHEESLKQNVV